jgi:hypothetical protein
MDSACHVIERVSNPRFLNEMTSYDVASAIVLATSSNTFRTLVSFSK